MHLKLSSICLLVTAVITSSFLVPQNSVGRSKGWGVVNHKTTSDVLTMSSNDTEEGQTRNTNFSKSRGGQGRGNSGYRSAGRGGRGGQGRGQGRGRGGADRPRFGGDGRGRGAGRGTTMRLENPLKVQRLRPPVQEGRGGGGRGDGRGRGGRGDGRGRGGRGDGRGRGGGRGGGRGSPAADASTRGIGGGLSDSPTTGTSNGPGRKGQKVKKVNTYDKKPRNSLRMNTSKKGRAASASMKRGSLKKRDRSREQAMKEERSIERRTVYLSGESMTVSDLAEAMDEKPVGVIKFLMTDLGVMASMTQSLDPATCIAVAEGMGKYIAGLDEEADEDNFDEESALEVGFATEEEDPDSLIPRPPVVTIMGHVDHGKTSLLDALRNTRVVSGEAGGITQHIGAYQIEQNDRKITFIDTPGHAAFTDMRQRGANITDIVILVVAADDGVKQQTADSLVCARQAGVPIIVAVNKIDLPTANVDRVFSDLTGYDVLTESLGGDVLSQEVSAKENTNLDLLLEKVLLQAELLDLKANPDRDAQGAIVEANVEKGFGIVAITLIQKGTLKVGDVFVAGSAYGRVKALITTDGKRIKEAGPSTPVKVVGFNSLPGAGDILVVCESEQQAKDMAENRNRIQRERESAAYQVGLLKAVAATFSGGKMKEHREMCVVIKADVQGSAEALARSLSDLKYENEETFVTVKVLVSEAGEVTKSDVAIASVTPATTIIAFNCAANFVAQEDARQQSIPIEYYNIVYDAIESVESRMQEVLSPTPEGEYVGSAIVQEVFNIGGLGNIAGSKCRDGIIKKGSNVRVMRGDKIITESTVKSLRNFKSEVESIQTGDECGVGLDDFEEFEVGDIVESYVEN